MESHPIPSFSSFLHHTWNLPLSQPQSPLHNDRTTACDAKNIVSVSFFYDTTTPDWATKYKNKRRIRIYQLLITNINDNSLRFLTFSRCFTISFWLKNWASQIRQIRSPEREKRSKIKRRGGRNEPLGAPRCLSFTSSTRVLFVLQYLK